MEKAHFNECIKFLGVDVGGKCSNDLSYLLFQKYEYLENDRFSKACKWLSNYYEGSYNSFPTMPKFKKAMEATAKTFSNFEEPSDDDKNYTEKEINEAWGDVRKKMIKMRLKSLRKE